MFRNLKKHVRPGALPDQAAHRADRVVGSGDRPSNRRGFTLVEVVIVIAIIGTVGTMGVLMYVRANTRYRVDAACGKLIADLRMAQTDARTTSTSRTVRFTAASAGYAILTDDEIGAGAAGIRVSLADAPYKASMTVLGVPGNLLVFDGRGEALSGGIVILKCGAVEKAVRIEPGLGRAYVNGTE